MKKSILGLAIVGVACLYSKPSIAQENETPQSRAFLGCLYHYADDLDDGVSDANTIAQVIGESCSKEGRATFAHVVTAKQLAADVGLQRAEAAAIHGIARTVVLKNRSLKRK